VVACVLFSCTEKHEGIRIAAPEDFCGILARYLMRDKELVDAKFIEKALPLMDCCGTTTEWAMSADEIDVAWLCPDAAENLLKKDDRFLIMGPALVNSYILVVRGNMNPKRIAYSQKREYQKSLIQERFGIDCDIIPVMPTALPYVYERGNVDGVVIDVLKGLDLKGKHMRLSNNNKDIITYMLVVSKEFHKSARFPQFLSALKNSVEMLNDINVLGNLGDEEKKSISPVELKQIVSLSVRFLSPQMQ